MEYWNNGKLEIIYESGTNFSNIPSFQLYFKGTILVQ
jgi:hypothetical protein